MKDKEPRIADESESRPLWELKGLQLVREPGAIEWVLTRLSSEEHEVGTWVPGGYEAYARILNPVQPPSSWKRQDDLLRWSEVADVNGWVLGPAVTFDSIANPDREKQPSSGTGRDGEGFNVLPVPTESGWAELTRLLQEQTVAPGRCWFAVYAGRGDLGIGLGVPDEPPLIVSRVQQREYLLYRGPLRSWSPAHGDQFGFVPNMCWPDTREWFLSSDVDFTWMYIGGSTECIETLKRSRLLEVVNTDWRQVAFWAGVSAPKKS